MSAEAAGLSPLEQLVPSVEHLIKTLDPLAVTGSAAHPVKLGWSEVALSTYTVFFFIAIALTLVVVFAAKKRMAIVPKGRFVNAFEVLVEFVRKNIIDGCIHHHGERYVPFIATVFFFVLVNNLLGLIPGLKAGNGNNQWYVCFVAQRIRVFHDTGHQRKRRIGLPEGNCSSRATFMGCAAHLRD